MPEPFEYRYKASLDRIIDGDTIDVFVDLGMKITSHQRLRLFGIDAPEPKGETRTAGLESTDYLNWLFSKFCLDDKMTVQTYKDKSGRYGRYLAAIWGNNVMTPVCLNSMMVEAEHAVEKYYGSRERLPGSAVE